MRNDTRLAFNQYVEQIATLSGVPDATVQFSVEPSVQQTLETRMQESSDFLSRINILGVDEMKGERVGLGVSSPIASRTDTSQKERQTTDPTGLTSGKYECAQTNFDTHITYARLDAWAKFPDFQTRVRDAILRRQALDRIMIGWNGTSAADQTNPVENPLLQDVNIGWLEQLRLNAPERVMAEGKTAGKLTVGASGDYKTLDALVYDLRHSLLESWARNDTELVAIVGDDLLHDKYFPLVNVEQAPTEQIARDVIMSTKRLGGLPAVQVPFFLPGAVLVTRLDNLSIYYQNGKRRRAILDNPKRNRIENFESSNDAYVVEDTDYAALAENIEIVEATE